jgi:uncharacterized Zn-finger protein
MRRRAFRMIGSLSGLIAILMISLAPTISQSLAARDNGDVPCDMPAMQHGHAHEHSGAANTGFDACAYCSLLAHLPAVLTLAVVFALVARTLVQRVATRFRSALLIEPTRPGQPRAPPFSAS